MAPRPVPELPFSKGGENYRLKPDRAVKTIDELDLSTLSVEQILAFRSQIEAFLPARSLRDIDLSKELVLQVLALQVMQQTALETEGTPVNQMAQAANSLSAALVNLVKVQSDVYSSERLKKIENLLIRVLNKLPSKAQEEFLAEYEAGLTSV